MKAAWLAAIVVLLAMASSARAEVRHAMRIDSTALTSPAFYIADIGWREGTSVETVELAEGTHYLQPNSGTVMGCALTVTGAGTWSYDTACDGFLSGRGTDTLRLIGVDITLDPSALTTPIYLVLVRNEWFSTARTMRVLPTLPGYSYIVSPGSGVNAACTFGVGLDGRITYPDEFEGCLSGRGTRTVTFNGVAVNVDARRLSAKHFTVTQAGLSHQRTDIVQRYRLLPTASPTAYGGWLHRAALWPSLALSVGLDGRVDYPAAADGWVSGRGTDTLVIRGYAIDVDATATAPGTFMIPEGNDSDAFDRAGVHTLRLAPVRHAFGSPSTEEFHFTVREQDGTIEVGDDAGPCVSGAGTTRLTVGCSAPAPIPAPEPTPPPPPPVRNVEPPQIRYEARSAAGTTYVCGSGVWENVPPSPRVEFAWIRLGSITGSLGGVVRETPDVPVGGRQTYTVAPADYGKRFYCSITIAGVTASSAPTVLTGRNDGIGRLLPRFYGNFRIRGIDVFQIVQPNDGATMFGFPDGAFPASCGGGTPTSFLPPLCKTPADPQHAFYEGVSLDQRKPTVALAYVTMSGLAASDPAQPLDVTLTGYVGSQRLGDARTRQITNPRPTGLRYVISPERADPALAVRFAVPAAWLAASVQARRALTLEARVALPLGAGSGLLRECPLEVRGSGVESCGADNRFQLDDVPVFDDLPDLTVRSLALLRGGQTPATLQSPWTVLRSAVKLFPGGQRLTIPDYQGAVDISVVDGLSLADERCTDYPRDLRSCLKAHVAIMLDEWWLSDAQNRRGYDLLMGVHHYAMKPGEPGDDVGGRCSRADCFEPGFKRGDTTIASRGEIPTITVNGTMRPLTAAAHEFGHALGLPHADTICGSKDGEAWPPDNTGRLQGTGFDRQPISFGGAFTYSVRSDWLFPFYDLMSYCADESNGWLSARNWQRTFATLQGVSAGRRALRAAPRTGQALALGTAGPGGARIERVIEADPENVAPPPDPSSRLRVRALDASGGLLGESAADVRELEDAPGVGTFVAAVPPGAAAVELVSGGAVVDRRVRSRAPSVRVLSARRAGSGLSVRWTARDPDGDELRATIEYAADGRTWRIVHQGPSRGRATVPARLLVGGARARFRVSVDDGFNRARHVSAPVRVAGKPPTPRIVTPDAGESPQTGRVLLIGAAHDERGRSLRGRALTWFAGSRRLGTGERLSASLPAGRVNLRLEARDAAGRTAAVRQRLTVAPVTLQLQVLRAPERVKPAARTVSILLATTTPATLRAGGRAWPVGPRTRTLRLPLPARPRSGLLRVELTITARGPRQPALRRTLVALRD